MKSATHTIQLIAFQNWYSKWFEILFMNLFQFNPQGITEMFTQIFSDNNMWKWRHMGFRFVIFNYDVIMFFFSFLKLINDDKWVLWIWKINKIHRIKKSSLEFPAQKSFSRFHCARDSLSKINTVGLSPFTFHINSRNRSRDIFKLSIFTFFTHFAPPSRC